MSLHNETSYMSEALVDGSLFISFSFTQFFAFWYFVRKAHMPSVIHPLSETPTRHWRAFLSTGEKYARTRHDNETGFDHDAEAEEATSHEIHRKSLTTIAVWCCVILIISFALVACQVVAMFHDQCFFLTCRLFFFLKAERVSDRAISSLVVISTAMIFWSMAASAVFVVVFLLATNNIVTEVDDLTRALRRQGTDLTNAMLAHECVLAYRRRITKLFNR